MVMVQLSGAVCQISAILKFNDTVHALKQPSADAVIQNGCTIGGRVYGISYPIQIMCHTVVEFGDCESICGHKSTYFVLCSKVFKGLECTVLHIILFCLPV